MTVLRESPITTNRTLSLVSLSYRLLLNPIHTTITNETKKKSLKINFEVICMQNMGSDVLVIIQVNVYMCYSKYLLWF